MFNPSKSVYIYGTDRVQTDFEYIFNKIDVKAYLCDDSTEKFHNEKPLININDYNAGEHNSLIIICGFDYEDKKRILDNKGLKYGEEFILAHDLFGELDYPWREKSRGRKLAVWGTSVNAAKVLCSPEIDVTLLIDNDKSKAGGVFHGIHIIGADTLDSGFQGEYYIIVASEGYYEIRQQLSEMGFKEDEDFIYFRRVVPAASELLRQTIYDKSCYDLSCNSFYNTLEVSTGGKTHCCCTSFYSVITGNLLYDEFEEVWMSALQRVLCLSASNKTYTFCKKDMCPLLMNRSADNEFKSDYLKDYIGFDRTPKILLTSFDNSCNLYCKSCRNEVKVIPDQQRKKYEIVADKILGSVMHYPEFLIMSGSGEVLLSKNDRKILTDERSKHVKWLRLLTNGTLFTKKVWDEVIRNQRDSEILITVSIDAATKETYEKLRRGGNFDSLYDNLKFASQLRKTGELAYFRMNFVVQMENYHEMPLFVKLGKELGVDEVFFTKILQVGDISDEEYPGMTIYDLNGNLKKEVEEVLRDPIMSDKIVDLGTINWNRKVIKDMRVDNYYIWEMERNFKFDSMD